MSLLSSTGKNLKIIHKGFPAELQDLTSNVFKNHVKQHESYPISTDEFYLDEGQKVLIPSRIHTDLYIPKNLSGTEKLIYDCIYSCSTNGYAREKALRNLYATKLLPFWVMPYIYQSLSDYVIEISSIVSLDDKEVVSALQKLSRLNPEQHRLTEARATSYWSAYYRHRFSRQEYPALKVIDHIQPLT